MDKKNSFGAKNSKKSTKTFSLNYWQIFDIPLFGRGMVQVLKIIEDWLDSEAKSKWIATVNPEFVMKAVKDNKFKALLKETDLNVVDGIGLFWAKEINGNFLKRLVTGVKTGGEILIGKHRESLVSGSDLIPSLCQLASKKNYKVFFLGGFGDRARRTMEYFKKDKIKADYCSGEPEFSNDKVLSKINQFKPDILFVAYGMKKQEEWIRNNRNKASFGVAVGVGRSFDYYSGDLKRAPLRWRRMGMEWLYSLIKEPKRWKRQLVLPQFVWRVLKSK